MANYFDRFDPEHEAFGPGDAPTPLNGVMRFSPRGGPGQLDAARGVSDNPSIPTPASASGPNAPASAPEPYRELRPLRRATPSDPSRPDAGEALAVGAFDMATLKQGDKVLGALSSVPQAAEIPVDAAVWLHQQLAGDEASTDEATRRINEGFAKTIQAYQVGRDAARHRRHQAEDEYPRATTIGSYLGSIAVANRLGLPWWSLLPFAPSPRQRP